MGLWASLSYGLWAGLFASSIGMILTAPPRYFVPTFLCPLGVSGRLTCDVFMSWGVSQNWSTMVATTLIAFVAVSVALNANIGKVSATSLAITLGLVVGMSVVRLCRREEVWEGV